MYKLIKILEKGTLLDYEDDKNDQYKSYTLHSSNEEEEIYEPVQISGEGHLCFMQPVGSEQIEKYLKQMTRVLMMPILV
uniref:Uncharacterized protein n=1 Tax=Romanomermis culicivorax TaxID=13658 RepID=A0A915IMY4_ROMCU